MDSAALVEFDRSFHQQGTVMVKANVSDLNLMRAETANQCRVDGSNPADPQQLFSRSASALKGICSSLLIFNLITHAANFLPSKTLIMKPELSCVVLWSGEVWEFLTFTDRHPAIIYNILLFGITSALGQTFIFMTVVYFGPLTCSIITTTRKFFTILGSVLLFGNVISPLQWFGTILVFLGLGLDAKFGKSPKKTPH
ncbi:solute carrier family 35 member B1 [Pimephales promelas]|nr:solute carrier family 35 member B1 [Pimephales promelas]